MCVGIDRSLDVCGSLDAQNTVRIEVEMKVTTLINGIYKGRMPAEEFALPQYYDSECAWNGGPSRRKTCVRGLNTRGCSSTLVQTREVGVGV